MEPILLPLDSRVALSVPVEPIRVPVHLHALPVTLDTIQAQVQVPAPLVPIDLGMRLHTPALLPVTAVVTAVPPPVQQERMQSRVQVLVNPAPQAPTRAVQPLPGQRGV